VSLPTTYDSLFARHAGRLPVAYLRALSKRESNMNPNAANPGGADAAKGILQVVGVLRNDYNRRNGTNYQPNDMFDPEINVKIAAWLLNSIVTAYNKHPSPNMKTDWSNPEFVRLVTAGWNAGFSEGGGVGKVARYLEQQGKPVTLEAVSAAAPEAGASKWLAIPARIQWHDSVAKLFYEQPDWGKRAAAGAGLLVVLVGAVGMFLYLRSKRA
jgi:soluble lytic murein transglycosylase-like protein